MDFHKDDDLYAKFKIKEFKYWELFLHKKQYYLGRTYIWAKRDELTDLMDCTKEEREELWEVGNKLKVALSELYKPDFYNWVVLANETPHCHMHVIPRYISEREFQGYKFQDKNWGKNYADYDRDFEIPDDTLIEIKENILKLL